MATNRVPVATLALAIGLISGPAISALGAPSDSRIVFIGTFYTERFTEEHEYLDQVDLWRDGYRAFGLTSSVAGLVGDQIPILRRFDGTISDLRDLHLSNGFRGAFKDSMLSGIDGDSADVELRRSPDQMGTNPHNAPRISFEAWRNWADSLIDAAEARHPYIRQELAKCLAGDGRACVGIGNRLKERKPDEARRYWKMACDRGNWAGCKFFGDESRYRANLIATCNSAQKPPYERASACGELKNPYERASACGELKKLDATPPGSRSDSLGVKNPLPGPQ
jgi:hypothetical protein